MILGMTKGELGLVVFVFLLVYGAGFIGRAGGWLARVTGGDRDA